MKAFCVAYNVLFLRRWVWVLRGTRGGLLYASNLSCLPGFDKRFPHPSFIVLPPQLYCL